MYMAQVNISEASRMTGVSRTTIHRKLNSGVLSISEGKIDTSDLIRVFGELVTHEKSVPNKKSSTNTDTSVQVVQELSSAQKENELLKQVIQDLRQDKQDLREEKLTLLALLEHNPQRKSENSPPREYDSHDTDNTKHSINTHTPEREKIKAERKNEGRVVKLARFLFDT